MLLLVCRFNLGSREVEAEGGKILRATDPDYNFGATVANEKVFFVFCCGCNRTLPVHHSMGVELGVTLNVFIPNQ